MAAIMINVPLEDEDIDMDILKRTVKITVSRKDHVHRKDIVCMLEEYFDNMHCVEAVEKRENIGEWFVTLSSDKPVKMLLDKASHIWKGKRFCFCTDTL
ncbi:hypothetical protein SNE40_019247 [Patella caerulea]|uniref:Uncharacterized protein n=1 Tax=Patella caerulea TaxID=87958 RepID=A0AAN8J885_PATCE